MKFTQAQNIVLTEIYRRLNYLHKGDLTINPLLLTVPSQAKHLSSFELIKPYNKEIPRCHNWYSLTEKGKRYFANYQTKSKLSEDLNLKMFEGSYIKDFDKSLLE